MATSQSCANCRFWADPEGRSKHAAGECHRFPPSMGSPAPDLKVLIPMFPKTYEEMSCGCWQAHDKEAPKKKTRSAKRAALDGELYG